jgi:hypothetical protein
VAAARADAAVGLQPLWAAVAVLDGPPVAAVRAARLQLAGAVAAVQPPAVVAGQPPVVGAEVPALRRPADAAALALASQPAPAVAWPADSAA